MLQCFLLRGCGKFHVTYVKLARRQVADNAASGAKPLPFATMEECLSARRSLYLRLGTILWGCRFGYARGADSPALFGVGCAIYFFFYIDALAGSGNGKLLCFTFRAGVLARSGEFTPRYASFMTQALHWVWFVRCWPLEVVWRRTVSVTDFLLQWLKYEP